MGRDRRARRAGWLLFIAFATLPLDGQAQTARKDRDAEPRIVPESASSAGSEFLRPPGSDRHGPSTSDDLEVPPWRQTTFFGIRARGQFFIYVVDCSGSMIDDDRLIRAKRELRRSVWSLQPPQRFKVIFYNDQSIPMPGDPPRPADLTSKNQLNAWLRLIEPDGETDPRSRSPSRSRSVPTPSSCSPTASSPRGPSRRSPGRTRARSRSTASTSAAPAATTSSGSRATAAVSTSSGR